MHALRFPRSNHRSASREHGQGLTEFALILPILLLLVMGIFDFGRVLAAYSMASNSVRDALRQAMIIGAYVQDPSAIPGYRNCELLRGIASQVFFIAPEEITIRYIDRDSPTLDTLMWEPDPVGAPGVFEPVDCLGADAQTFPDDVIETGDIIEISYKGTVSLVTPLISGIVPAIEMSFTGHRTLVKEIVLHGNTDSCTNDPVASPDPGTWCDLDFDGLPDWWEDKHFGNDDGFPEAGELAQYGAGDDPDNDGCPNGCEVVNGSDPWVADTDGDTLSDGDEVYRYVTDPTLVDTDDDCIVDNLEVDAAGTFYSDAAFAHLQPLAPTNPRLDDTDGDGLTDGEELGLCDADLDDDGTGDVAINPATDPHKPDTDMDGLTDFEELAGVDLDADGTPDVFPGTDPLDDDSDDDGLLDGEEVFGPFAGDPTCRTDPMDEDNDGDLTRDGDEVSIGRNPCVQDTTLSVEDRTVGENVGSFEFLITLTNPPYHPTIDTTVTVQYTIGGGDATPGGDCSTEGVDYVAPSSGTATFGDLASLPPSAGTTLTFAISITICDDVLDETDPDDETFNVTLSGATPGGAIVISVGSATVTITDDDSAPVAGDMGVDTDEDTPVEINVTLLVTDPDDDLDPSSLKVKVDPANGTAIANGAPGSLTFTYTPDPDFNGLDEFTYEICDLKGACDDGIITINVDPVDDPPVAVDDQTDPLGTALTTVEETPINIDVLFNDSDVDDPTKAGLSVSAITQAPANGTAVINPDNTITYTPNDDFNGIDTFTYELSDDTGLTDTAAVTVEVTGVNDPPTAVDDDLTVVLGDVLTIPASDLLANDTDPDPLDVLTLTEVTDAITGTVAFDGVTITYTPGSTTGTDQFTYTIKDDVGMTATATVTVTITSQPPEANDDEATTDEDAAVNVNVLDNDSDPDGEPLTVFSVGTPANGSAVIESDNTITYTPSTNFHGTDSFSYTIKDPTGGTDTATVEVTVNPVNDPPVAVDDPVAADDRWPVRATPLSGTVFDVLANDSDVDGDTLTVTAVTQGAHGTVTFSPGNVTYTPAAGYIGSDSFTYTVSDGNGGTAVGTVNVTVFSDPPDAVDDAQTVVEDTPTIIDVLINDTDPENDPLSITGVTDPPNGTVSVAADGLTVTYTPDANYNGPDSFTYTVSDGMGGTDTATVTITVTPVNDAPDAVDDGEDTQEDTSVTVNVLTNDTDPDNDPLTVTAVTQGSKGSVSFTSSSVTYTPNANANGEDTFTYTVSDGNGGTDTATVTISITPVNDAPIANDDSVTVARASGLQVVVDVLANDTDVDGNSLNVTNVTQVTGPASTTTINPNGTITLTPPSAPGQQPGAYTFTYTISDGNGGTASATIHLTITT